MVVPWSNSATSCLTITSVLLVSLFTAAVNPGTYVFSPRAFSSFAKIPQQPFATGEKKKA